MFHFLERRDEVLKPLKGWHSGFLGSTLLTNTLGPSQGIPPCVTQCEGWETTHIWRLVRSGD